MSLKPIVENLCVAGVALFFLAMGVGALVDPNSTLSYFSAGELGPDMRNEVRAVYGGYGVAIASLLMASIGMPEMRRGVRFAVLVSLSGMAGGRVFSMALETPAGEFPLTILLVEFVLIAMLAVVLGLQTKSSVNS